MTMKDAMEAEKQEAIETLQRANDLLFKMFGLSKEDDKEWEESANLTHAQQMERYGWCVCDDQGTLVQMDCPVREGEE